MATTTQNLGLIKPAGTDKIRIAQINSNMDTIDAKMGPVGSTPLQTQATNAASSISSLQSGLAIICNGNTHAAIEVGQYAYVKNHASLSEGLYKATAAIAANGTLSTSNLVAVSGGVLNAMAGMFNTKNSYVTATSLSQFESVLNTVCQTLSPGEFKFIQVLPNWSGSFTGGAGSLAIVHHQNTAGLYNCFILFGGAQGYYYSSAWHWQKPAQTVI